MPATARRDDPTTIAQLVSKLENAFEKGCGPLSDEVKHLVDASRRIDGGYECARGLLRARFGPAADARATPGSWPRLLMALMTLLLAGIASGVGILAWLAWQTGPKIDRVLSSLSIPAEIEFDVAPATVVAGQILKNPPAVKIYDRMRGPVSNVEVEFTISDPTATAASAFILNAIPSPLIFKDSAGNVTYDFENGFDASGFNATKLGELGTAIGGKLKIVQKTLSDGRASVPSMLVVPKVGTDFTVSAKVLNSSISLEKTITIKVVAAAPTLTFVPDTPVAAINAVFSLKVQGSGTDKFKNNTVTLPSGADVSLTTLDDHGVSAADVTIASDDAAVVVKDSTWMGKTDASGVVDFGKVKFTKATKEKNYKLKADRVSNDPREAASSGVSKTFRVTDIP